MLNHTWSIFDNILHNSGQEKENRIWSSFIWNSSCFPAWGLCQRVGVWHKTLALGNLESNQRAVTSLTDLGLLDACAGEHKFKTLIGCNSEKKGELDERCWMIMSKRLKKKFHYARKVI